MQKKGLSVHWKLEMETETLFLHSVHIWLYIFISSFDFGTKQELYPKKFMPQIDRFLKSHPLL